jgi:hypothetical protein
MFTHNNTGSSKGKNIWVSPSNIQNPYSDTLVIPGCILKFKNYSVKKIKKKNA